MQACKRHRSESQPGGGGVCASCLAERLAWLWRGESFRLDKFLAPSVCAFKELPLGSGTHDTDSRPLVSDENAASLGSVRKQVHESGVAKLGDTGAKAGDGVLPQISSDGLNGNESNGEGLNVVVVDSLGDGDAVSENTRAPKLHLQNSKDTVMVEWTEFHARRRRNLDLKSPKSRSFDSLEPKPSVKVIMDTDNFVRRVSVESNPRVSILKEQKFRSRSMPLDNRNAEDTAARVIREQADDLYSDELDFFGTAETVHDRDSYGTAGTLPNMAEQKPFCFSPKWQSKNSPKWVQALISPMTSRNKVFPSRGKEDVRKGSRSRRRLTRFASSDWNPKKTNRDEVSPKWIKSSNEQHQRTTTRSSVFSWLQNADRAQLKKGDQTEQPTSSSSSNDLNSESTDSWLKDLITVGHLHEIAEELETVEESSEEEESPVLLNVDSLEDISSFGKFLLIAAQRQPKAGLTRLVSVTSN